MRDNAGNGRWLKKVKILKTGLSILRGRCDQHELAPDPARTTAPSHCSQKYWQLLALDERAQAREWFAQAYNEQAREPSLRNRGRRGVSLFIKNSFFSLSSGISTSRRRS